MAGSCFFDTNVLIYIASSDAPKAQRAVELIAEGGKICIQVLNEITSFARRKMGMSWNETRSFLSPIRGLLSVESMTVAMHEEALILAERYMISVYDAAIIASALEADCNVLFSGDMHNRLVIRGKPRVVNPFRYTHQ
jgi:predicted nucleic acid-binding protein